MPKVSGYTREFKDQAVRLVVAEQGSGRAEDRRVYAAGPRPESELHVALWVGEEGGAAAGHRARERAAP